MLLIIKQDRNQIKSNIEKNLPSSHDEDEEDDDDRQMVDDLRKFQSPLRCMSSVHSTTTTSWPLYSIGICNAPGKWVINQLFYS